MNFSARQLIEYFKTVVEVMENEKDYLCELDRKLGDGDHGVTMSIGWQAVNEKLTSELDDETDCGKISLVVGKTFLNAVGSSVGPLYATGFMRGAKEIRKKSALNDTDLTNFWIAFCEGIKERGKATVGDKTMVDTIEPTLQTLKQCFSESGDFLYSFKEAVSAGKTGMESTTELISKIGRSSRLGERSKGTQDPGATSCYILLETFLKFIESKTLSESN